MSFLKKLQGLFAPPTAANRRSLWLYVQCDRCGEILRGRVDLLNDLSIRYDDENSAYFSRKVFIGSQRCYRPIEIKLSFDKNRNLIDRQIEGGKFVDEEAYLAADSSEPE